VRSDRSAGIVLSPFCTAIILILRLLRWNREGYLGCLERSDYLFCATGLGVALLVMLPFALEASEFGPTITAAKPENYQSFCLEVVQPSL